MVFVHTSRYDMASTPIGRAKLRYQKKFTYNIEIQKWSNHGLQMTKLKIQVKFFQD